jgi:cytochrome oxidase Cu insertion factor (SCO1/SenC/PrrC family)
MGTIETKMKAAILGALLLSALLPLGAEEMPGVKPGTAAPDFHLRDQFGKIHTLESLKGENGVVLLFFRSADW